MPRGLPPYFRTADTRDYGAVKEPSAVQYGIRDPDCQSLSTT